ncbi:hypothetical protein BDN70DRAFT_885493 [Pholiota conissans]|uniref:Uncharacterized protein n=1 Tax=Pholiota conissans TaxID=109636 RepID=A0A9P5YQ30_9AGAR|nr:hypothetical protein BDN70DRAFT_885493 [Pholiota conissans]
MEFAAPPSMTDHPAFPRTSIPPRTTIFSTVTAGSSEHGSRVHCSRSAASTQADDDSTTTSTSSTSRQAHKLLGMLVGERRSRAERERQSREGMINSVSVTVNSLRSSAEHAVRLKTKSTRSLKSLFAAHSNTKPRRSSTNTPPYPRMGFFKNSRKSYSSSTYSHATHDNLIQPRNSSVFFPSLPAELWLLILKYASYPPFVDLPSPSGIAKPSSPSNPSYTRAYPYPTTYDPNAEALTFLHHPTAHTHLPERLAAYRAQMRAKAALRRVCRAWSVIAHEILYEFVWIASAREGRELAGKLCGDVGAVPLGATVSVGRKVDEAKEKETVDEERKGSFGRKWMGKAKRETVATADSRSIISRKSSSFALPPPSVGRWIKRLHVETRSLERCSPHDLLLILQHCPNLEEYSDYKSIRRPMHPLVLSLSDVAPFSIGSDNEDCELVARQRQQQQQHQQALLTPDALLYNLLSRPLRRLTWTNYDYDSTDFESGVRFYEDVVAPKLSAMGGQLEYLELVLSGTAMWGMGQRSSMGWGVGGNADVFGQESRGVGGLTMSLAKNPAQGIYGAANMLTQLEAAYTSTSVTAAYPPSVASLSLSDGGEPITSIDGFAFALSLPSLRALKATLDDATFVVLSTWDMPSLEQLAIVAADYGYAAPGFRRFFEVHGSKLRQLELGHSSGAIEEAWITEPAGQSYLDDDSSAITLEAWCPLLKEFICSADAEWNWQRPDWIAPHVLLPSHKGVKFIGVRDMEKRLMSDLDEALRRRRGDGGRTRRDNFEVVEGWEDWEDGDEDEEVEDQEVDEQNEEEEDGEESRERREDDPYFALLQQFGSLLRPEAFPALRYVRDMSWESDIMRRTCTMRPLPSSAIVRASPPPPEPLPLHTACHNPHASYTSPFLVSSATSSSATHGQHQHWWSTMPAQKKHVSRADLVRSAEREAEEALVRAYGRRVNVFWRKVVRMCRGRHVWLEDCFGVNVTKANLKQAGAQ